jgi:hypothetical protein
MTKALFVLDSVVPPVEGYHDNSNRWNGWCTPYFNEANTRRICALFDILADVNEDGTTYTWDESSQQLVEVYYESGSATHEVIHPTMIEGERHYPIGYYCYCWEVYKNKFDATSGCLNAIWRVNLTAESVDAQIVDGGVDRDGNKMFSISFSTALDDIEGYHDADDAENDIDEMGRFADINFKWAK